MQRFGRELLERARGIRAVILDVDGVLTDASLFYGPKGEALKRFSARDGFAVKTAQNEGLWIAILSGRVAPPLKARLADLGILPGLVVEGSRDKRVDIAVLAEQLETNLAEIAFMGDDIPDLPALGTVGLAACPSDAAPEVRERCHFVSSCPGGQGAIRELVELLLTARGRWQEIVRSWAEQGAPPGYFESKRGTPPRA